MLVGRCQGVLEMIWAVLSFLIGTDKPALGKVTFFMAGLAGWGILRLCITNLV